MVRVIIDNLTKEEAEYLIHSLKCEVVEMKINNYSRRTTYLRRDKSWKLIRSILSTNKGIMRFETLFRNLKMRGYIPGRKSFERDIKHYIFENKIKREIIIGGKFGSTSYVKLIEK